MTISVRTANKALDKLLRKVEPNTLNEVLGELGQLPGNKSYRESMQRLQKNLNERLREYQKSNVVNM